MYKIEKNIPVTNKSGKKSQGKEYPFSEMEVGDSFYVEFDEKKYRHIDSLRSSITQYAVCYTKQNPNTKFKTSADEFGIRVWRIK